MIILKKMEDKKILNILSNLKQTPKQLLPDINSSSTLSSSPNRYPINHPHLQLTQLKKPLHCPKLLMQKIKIHHKNIICRDDHIKFKQNFLNTSLSHIHSPEIFNKENIRLEVSCRFKTKILTVCYYAPIRK